MTERITTSTPAIAVENVTKQYGVTDRTTTTALADVSFRIEPGEFVTVIGPSGCGKTTLVRLIGGLEAPTAGQLRVNGKLVEGPAPTRAMVFQDYRLFPWLTVRENVAFGLVERGVPDDKRTERVRRMLELVGLAEVGDAYPAELSGGMKQRVGLARALAVDPTILLMDEPFGSVDAQTRHRLQRELLDIWAEMEKTVLFVTHDIEEAVTLGDRVLVLTGSPGRIHDCVCIDLPRPRDRMADEFVEYTERLVRLISADE